MATHTLPTQAQWRLRTGSDVAVCLVQAGGARDPREPPPPPYPTNTLNGRVAPPHHVHHTDPRYTSQWVLFIETNLPSRLT